MPQKNFDGCNDFFGDDKKEAELYELYMGGFMMVEDGECTWETKARNVQRLGVQALLIATDDMMTVDSREFHQSDSKYDGTGHMIDIPTLLIDTEHAEMLLDIYHEVRNKSKQQIILNAHIGVDSKFREQISYTMYYGSILDLDF